MGLGVFGYRGSEGLTPQSQKCVAYSPLLDFLTGFLKPFFFTHCWGLGFRVQFRVQGLGFKVQGLRFRVDTSTLSTKFLEEA